VFPAKTGRNLPVSILFLALKPSDKEKTAHAAAIIYF
jgi:hypothetical protein